MADRPHGTVDAAALLGLVQAWRLAPETPVPCPVCRQAGIVIIDRSTRPYAEWYQIDCPACGVSETLNVPLGPPVMGGSD
jgi:hypothetical protein